MEQRYENQFSDYGSGNTSDSSTMSWRGHDKWSQVDVQHMKHNKQKSSSYADLMTGRCTIDDVMQEFKSNGFDSPYTPEDDASCTRRYAEEASGISSVGPSSAYLRQKSWPEPERTPVARLPPRWHEPQPSVSTSGALSAAQLRVLGALPAPLLRALLDHLQLLLAPAQPAQPAPTDRTMRECRFCKNNGERESYYRSHALKGAGGRVACPVLRAFRCARCGASGDHAHTIKYCPLASSEERMKSAAMMRSVRLASGRRRTSPPEYVMFGETPTSLQDNLYSYGTDVAAPLEPQWAALEQKLMW